MHVHETLCVVKVVNVAFSRTHVLSSCKRVRLQQLPGAGLLQVILKPLLVSVTLLVANSTLHENAEKNWFQKYYYTLVFASTFFL